MSSFQNLAFACCVLLTSQWAAVDCIPRLATRQLTSGRVPSRMVSDNVCKNYMESCVPWETTCCNNMECMNLARGYCLYPLEKCLCQKTTTDFY